MAPFNRKHKYDGHPGWEGQEDISKDEGKNEGRKN